MQCATEGGNIMMEGEYNSMSELYRLAPSFVPKPHAWGTFRSANPTTHFFLCDFVDMDNQLPDPSLFCTRLAEIHLNSVSPTGQFGFMVQNCHGKILQENGWDSSWSSFFTKLLASFLRIEIGINGPWKEYEEAFEAIFTNVIPQLLEPLQSGERTLKPSLVHGDLWQENAATNLTTGEPVVFDASAFYAHNEYELGTWVRLLPFCWNLQILSAAVLWIAFECCGVGNFILYVNWELTLQFYEATTDNQVWQAIFQPISEERTT